METKELNAEKYLELASNIYTQALEECKELLRSKGDKCYIYVTCEEKDNMIHLDGDGAMDYGWLVGVGLDGDNLLYCAYPYNDIPATIEEPWQVFDNGCYLCLESMPEVYSFIVGNLDKSVTKEEAIAVQEKDYDEYGLGQMPDFSFGWPSDDDDENDDEDEDEDDDEDDDEDSDSDSAEDDTPLQNTIDLLNALKF